MPLPTVILPGYLEGAIAYRPLEQSLQESGFPTVTVPLRSRDWVPTVGGRSMIPILRQLDRTVKQMLQQYNVSQLNLIGHSAGGWISRIYLGEKPYSIHRDVTEDAGLWHAHPYVATLVTLGTPHISGERWTRKNLDFVKMNYPGAFYSTVRYICVAGKSIFGARRPGQWLAYSSYKLTCGIGNTWGDGITPIEAAHLEGATNLVIEGVKHSPRTPGIWYGSPVALPSWVEYLA
ncbi:alpha/beta hydrolase [Coleofasciculus sp. FACHB-SPT9]|uniref:esterase/lipase family protein n=1 Tax=Cyanophyceae TaxID=3028117 RepID=UPI001685CCF8|nr:alpha/beta hydrolase [Coleofasciculus sp. FACHB-SPT9]MBD1888579.1 alpha/beta hydrolase [Coleofasciculus sp. FACHB-SPT9]